MRTPLFFLLSFLISHYGIAQYNVDKNYFMFPLKPGQTNYLSANMGELRNNHFHGGLDVRTDQTTGLPVFASAEGYISRIRISSYGYGRTLYIQHPNGLTTVYAHLDRFIDSLDQYIITKQYDAKVFDIDYFPKPNELPVSKGKLIAFSGNSGSSGGPHLHWEIRDGKERVLNPLYFGFPEIKDNLSPVFEKVGIKTFETDARVNQEFGFFEFTPYKNGTYYTLPSVIKAQGSIGIALKMHDRMSNSTSTYGVAITEMKVDGKVRFKHTVNEISFLENRYMNVHIDYENFINKGSRFEKCYIDDGNRLSTYDRTLGNGRLFIGDTMTHQIEITITDAYGYHATLKFQIKGTSAKSNIGGAPATAVSKWEVSGNILKITEPGPITHKASLWVAGQAANALPLSYYKAGHNIYLYDLRAGLPDSFQLAGAAIRKFDFVATVPSGQKYTYKKDHLTLEFSDTTLFDTLYLRLKTHVMYNGRETFEIHNNSTPIYGKVKAIYCPEDMAYKNEKCYFYSVNGSSQSFEGGEWDDDVDNLVYNMKNLGKYTVKKDTLPPSIKLKYTSASRIKFSIFDAGSGIQSFEATLDGAWVLMYYDHKTQSLWSVRQNENIPLKGELVLKVADRSGNIRTYQQRIP